jgi:hypothetical protein
VALSDSPESLKPNLRLVLNKFGGKYGLTLSEIRSIPCRPLGALVAIEMPPTWCSSDVRFDGRWQTFTHTAAKENSQAVRSCNSEKYL